MSTSFWRIADPRSAIGRVISLILALMLAFMTWNAGSIEMAFASTDDEIASDTAVTVEQDDENAAESESSGEEAPVPQNKASESEPPTNSKPISSSDGQSTAADEKRPASNSGITASVCEDTLETDEAEDGESMERAVGAAAATPPKDTSSRPAMTLSSNGVIVSAPEGALPPGTTMTVVAVPAESVAAAIDDALGSDKSVASVSAYDITLHDADGKEIQPDKPVTVTLPNAQTSTGPQELFHMDTLSDSPEKLADGTTASTTHFSIYAVVVVADAGTDDYEEKAGAYNIKIRYEDQDGNRLSGVSEGSYQLTAGMSVTISEIIGSNSQITTDDAVYTFENAYFYWSGHYSGTKCYVTSFSASTRSAGQYGSHLQFSGTLYGSDGSGTAGTWDYNDTGVLHLVYSSEELLPLTYHSNYGQDLTSSQNLVKNSSVTAMTYQQAFGEIPTNYSFKGWSDSPNGDVKWSAGSRITAKITQAMDLYAVWEISDSNAVVYYESSPKEAGNLSSTTEVLKRTYSSKTRQYRWDNPKGSTAVSKDGYVFSGWYCGGDLVTDNPSLTDLSTLWAFIPYDASSGECAGATFTAVFDEMPTISYKAEPGEGGGIDKVSERAYAGLTAPSGATATPTDGNWYFKGWYHEGDFVTSSPSITKSDIDRFALHNGAYENCEFTAVFAQPEELVLSAVSTEVKYNGAEQSASGYTGLPQDKSFDYDELSGISAYGKGKDVGNYTVKFSEDSPVRITATDGTVYDVRYEEGVLAILPREVSLASPDDEKEYDGIPLVNDGITVTGDGWAAGEGAIYAVDGSQLLPGKSANSFTYSLFSNTKAANYKIGKTEGELVVKDRSAKYIIEVASPSATALYDGKSHAAGDLGEIKENINGEEFIVSGLTAGVEETDAGNYVNEIKGSAVVTDRFGNDVSKQFNINPTEGNLAIAKRSITLTSASMTGEYTGETLASDKITVTGDGWAAGEGAEYTVTGRQLLPGSSDNLFTYALLPGTKAENYSIETVFGKLGIDDRADKPTLEIRAKSASEEEQYDGGEHILPAELEQSRFEFGEHVYTVSGLSVSGVSATDAGTYYNTVSGTPTVSDEFGNDVSDQFTVHVTSGKLTIVPRSVVLTSADDEKEYDGKPLTNDEIAVSSDGWAAGEGAAYNVSGTITLPGNIPNDFTYTLSANTKESNYKIEKRIGLLEVADRSSKWPVTLTSASDQAVYDGSDHTVSGFSPSLVKMDGAEFTISDITASATGSDAAVYPVEFSGKTVIRDMLGNDVTSQFSVEYETGSLTVSKRSVRLESPNAKKQYDGQPLSAKTVSVSGDGWLVGEEASYSAFAEQTLVGKQQNSFSYQMPDGTKASNYDVQVVFGELEVMDRTAKFTIPVKTNSASAVYNGSTHIAEGWAVEDGDAVVAGGNGRFSIGMVEYELSGLWARVDGVDAASYPNKLSGTPRIVDADGNDVSAQFDVVAHEGNLLIKQAAISASQPDDTVYNGDAQLMPVRVRDGASGKLLEQDSDYRIYYSYAIDAGTVTVTVNGMGNYTGTVECTYSILPAPLTVKTAGAAKVYDGKSLEEPTAEIFGLVNGETAEAVATGSQVVVGKSENSYKIDWNGTAKEANYEIVQEDLGALSILKRTVMLASGSAEKIYDGTELISDEMEMGEDGWVAGEGATYDFTGSQTEPGRSLNLFSYAPLPNTFLDNYNIRPSYGWLTVTEAETVIPPVDSDPDDPSRENGNEQPRADRSNEDVPERDADQGDVPADTAVTTTPAALIPSAMPNPAVPLVPAQPLAATPVGAAVVSEQPSAANARQSDVGESIFDDNTPLAGETIADDDVPLAGEIGSWSLFDLIATILSIGLFAILTLGLIGRNRKNGKDDDGEDVVIEIEKHRIRRILALIPAVATLLLLLFTQDFAAQMEIFDIWSLLFGGLLIAQVIIAIASKKSEYDDNNEDHRGTENMGYAAM